MPNDQKYLEDANHLAQTCLDQKFQILSNGLKKVFSKNKKFFEPVIPPLNYDLLLNSHNNIKSNSFRVSLDKDESQPLIKLSEPKSFNTIFKGLLQHLQDGIQTYFAANSFSGQRNENQDSNFIITNKNGNCLSCGIFDGHGTCGQIISQRLCDLFQGAMEYLIETFDNLNQTETHFTHWKSLGPGKALGHEVFGENLNCILSDWSNDIDDLKMKKQVLILFNRIQELLTTMSNVDSSTSGTTGLLGIRINSVLWIAWLGDSKCMGFQYRWKLSQHCESPNFEDPLDDVEQSTATLPLLSEFCGTVTYNLKVVNQYIHFEFRQCFETLDHSPSDENELQRIEMCGGHVISFENRQFSKSTSRLMPYGIAMSRSFGDEVGVEYGLSHQPDIVSINFQTEMMPNENDSGWRWAFVFGSDGLWDTTSPERISKDLVAGVIFDMTELSVSIADECTTNEESFEKESILFRYDALHSMHQRLQSICKEAQELRGASYIDDTTSILFFV